MPILKNKKILITGASGFIGAKLVRKLYKDNQVFTLSRILSNKWRLQDIQNEIKDFQIELDNLPRLSKIISLVKPEIIFHLAGYGGYSFQSDPQKIVKVNINHTFNLLQASQSINYEALIITGSSSEYGYKNSRMKENDNLEPVSFYAASKAGMTHLARVFGKTYQKPVIIVRPFSVYGPYEEPSRLIPRVIIRCLTGRDVLLTKGEESHDFIFIEDFLDGLIKICQNAGKLSGGIINLGGGRQISTRELAHLIKKLTSSKSKLLWGKYPNRIWDSKYWLADISFAKKILNWVPRHSLEEGLKKTIRWMEENRKYYEK